MREKNKTRRILFSGFAVMLSIWFIPMTVFAAKESRILQTVTNDDMIRCFVAGISEYDSVSAQIGQDVVEAVVESQPSSVHTVILVDNSLSITKENQEKIQKILTRLAETKATSEKISVAVYGEDIHYLVEETEDEEEVAAALQKIEYQNQDSYLTDVLYDEMGKLKGKAEYTRFIIATDGVDNKAIGYTREELTEYLKKDNYPIYTLGCKYKDNDQELENLFALSRLTGSKYFLLDDNEEVDDIAVALNEAVTEIDLKIPEQLRDGSARSLLVSFQTAEGEVKLSKDVSMPFGLRTESAPETVPVETVTQQSAEETLEETAQDAFEAETTLDFTEIPTEEPENGIDWVTVLAGAAILIAVLYLLVTKLKKKKPDNKEEKPKKEKSGGKKGKQQGPQNIQPEKIEDSVDDDGKTVLTPLQDDEKTEFITNKKFAYILTFIDRNEPGRVFRYPLISRVVIGRKMGEDVNLVLNYDPSVSARHCVITVENNVCYIEDLNSSNGTYLNGRRIQRKERLESNDEIRFGKLCMTVEITKTGERNS